MTVFILELTLITLFHTPADNDELSHFILYRFVMLLLGWQQSVQFVTKFILSSCKSSFWWYCCGDGLFTQCLHTTVTETDTPKRREIPINLNNLETNLRCPGIQQNGVDILLSIFWHAEVTV